MRVCCCCCVCCVGKTEKSKAQKFQKGSFCLCAVRALKCLASAICPDTADRSV